MATNEELDTWYNQLLVQSVKAGAASLKWEKRKQWLNDYMAANAANYASEKSRRDKTMGDWVLQDAMDTWNWHRREANRLAQLIQTELAYRAEQRRQGGVWHGQVAAATRALS